MPRHRLVMVVGQLHLGGLERQAWMLARGLDRDRFDVTVVSLEEGGVLFDSLQRDRVPVVQIARRGHLDWRRFLRLARLLRQIRPEFVYSFNNHVNAYSRLAAVLAGVPCVVTGERGVYLSRWQGALERILVALTDRVICNAEAVRRDLIGRVGLPARKVVVVRNGVEIPPPPGMNERMAARRDLGLPEEAFVVGTIARLHPVKNLGLFIEVARRCLGSLEAWFCIIGGGPEERSLRALAADPALKGRVLFAGSRTEARALLPAFDVFVLTSESEGLPNAVMEAMALGLPIVCTDVGGCRELVEDGVDGYLVPLQGAGLMADRILSIAGDSGLRLRLGTSARRRAVREFSLERMLAETETILTDLLARRASGPRSGRSTVSQESAGP